MLFGGLQFLTYRLYCGLIFAMWYAIFSELSFLFSQYILEVLF